MIPDKSVEEKVLIAMYRNPRNATVKFILKSVGMSYMSISKALHNLENLNMITTKKPNNKTIVINLTDLGNQQSIHLYNMYKTEQQFTIES